MTTLTIKTESEEVMNAVRALLNGFKVAFEEASPYDPEFVAKIEKSRQQVREGKTVKIDLDDIWK
ncbi:MAG: hypothetical protein J7619_05845 [Dyadobacter sp.]|uniref:DUF2683 family protein n=1 Tax=Dyadobacter sp. TaxID=1914288 RepID=UPI001B008E90|nr:DUF2683 family protein [Dyadobacter sp.]MBO9612196.1 hypothetical protein [Dyadobacter sp.]